MAPFPRAEQNKYSSYLRQSTMEGIHAQPSESSTPQTFSEPSTICWQNQPSTYDQMSQYIHTTAYQDPIYGVPYVLPTLVFDPIIPYSQPGLASQTPPFESLYRQCYYNQTPTESTVGYPQSTPAVDYGAGGDSAQQYRVSAPEDVYEYWSLKHPDVNTNNFVQPAVVDECLLRNGQADCQHPTSTVRSTQPKNTDTGHGSKPGTSHIFISDRERAKMDSSKRVDLAKYRRRENTRRISAWAAQVEPPVLRLDYMANTQDSLSDSSTVTSGSRVPKRRMSVSENDSSSVAPTIGSEEPTHQSVKRARTSQGRPGPGQSMMHREKRNTNACASCRMSHKKCDGHAVACEYKVPTVEEPYVQVPSFVQVARV